jgi:hypothetical protein
MTTDSARGVRIEIVLPLKPHNADRGSDLARAACLLASFRRFCDPAFIARFTIVAAAAELDQLAGLQSASDIKLTLLPEHALLALPKPVPQLLPRRGWYVQQMIKIAYAAICQTEFYLTLDADIVLADLLDASVLADGRAPVHHESVDDHRGWWPASAAALRADRSATDTPDQPVCGVTPAFISARIMRGVIRRLTLLAEADQMDWPDYLAARTTSDDRTWTEYALYWTQLLNTQDPAALHTPRRLYEFCHALDQAEARLRFGSNGQHALFGVLQSSYFPAPMHVDFVQRNLAATEPPGDRRRAFNLQGRYDYLDPRVVQSELEQYAGGWLVTAGARHTDTAAAAANGPRDWLVGHFPWPLPISRPDFRALYIVDDPVRTAVDTFRRDCRVDLCRNSNINYAAAWLESLTLAQYAAAGEDRLNLARHFTNWSDPTGPLRRITYPVLLLRGATRQRYADRVQDLFGSTLAAALAVPDTLEPHSPPPDNVLRRLHRMYAPLAGRIDAFPAAALWDPRSARMIPLDPPPGSPD